MEIKNYSKIMRLPKEERDSFIAEGRDNVFREGTEARTVLTYLSDYFEKNILAHFIAFSNLPMGATLEQFQTVWHALHAAQELESELRGKIEKVNRIPKEVLKKESFLNI